MTSSTGRLHQSIQNEIVAIGWILPRFKQNPTNQCHIVWVPQSALLIFVDIGVSHPLTHGLSH